MQGDLLGVYQSNTGERWYFLDQVVAVEVDSGYSMVVEPAWFHSELDAGYKRRKEVKDDSVDFDLSSW